MPDRLRSPCRRVGYRIAKPYCQHAPDKHQVLVEIFGMRDAKAFLVKKGRAPAAAPGK